MANSPNDLRDPWLVGVWPGMGSIALLAGSYLLQELSVRRVAELSARDYFEIQSVEVKDGLARLGRLPRSLFFEWKNPKGKHDLLIFAGEAQPVTGGYELCQKVIDYAMERGVKQCFTFAAMATQLTPGTTPRVFAVATDAATLKEVETTNVEVLEDGQITGLNGLLLAAGAERGLRGTCLLGELPYFAVGVPNPRAAKAVLERFTELADIEIDFTELEEQAKAMEENLEQLMEQMSQGTEEDEEEDDEGEGGEEPAKPGEAQQAPAPAPTPTPDPRTRRRIEALFERAKQDRSKAFELKRELDRLGVFKLYEDRFLDLFRNAQ